MGERFISAEKMNAMFAGLILAGMGMLENVNDLH